MHAQRNPNGIDRLLHLNETKAEAGSAQDEYSTSGAKSGAFTARGKSLGGRR